jgi:hypothetical protein
MTAAGTESPRDSGSLTKRRVLASALRDRMSHGVWTTPSVGTSMEPGIPAGSEVEVLALSGVARLGEVLVFVPSRGEYLCGHRVIAVQRDGSALTRGDATGAPDEWVEPARQVGTASRFRLGGRWYRVASSVRPGSLRRLRARVQRRLARLSSALRS